MKKIPRRYRRAIRHLFGAHQMEKMKDRYDVTPRSLMFYLRLAHKNHISMESLWIAKIVPFDYEDKDEEDYPPGSLAESYYCSIPPPLSLDSSQTVWTPPYLPSPLSLSEEEEEEEEEKSQSTKPLVKCDLCLSGANSCACPSCDLCFVCEFDKTHTCIKAWFDDRSSEN
jgi:hypothetical protein